MKPILSKGAIETTFQNYLDTIAQKNFLRSLEFIEQELFQYMSREEILQFFEETYNNPNLAMKLREVEVINISDIRKIESKYYSLVDYKLALHLILEKEIGETNSEFKERMIEAKFNFEDIFGIENLEYIKDLDYFKVTSFERAIAINTSDSSSWKFLIYDEEELVILAKIIPRVLMLELNFHLNN